MTSAFGRFRPGRRRQSTLPVHNSSKFAHFTHHVHSFDDRPVRGAARPRCDDGRLARCLERARRARSQTREDRAYDAPARCRPWAGHRRLSRQPRDQPASSRTAARWLLRRRRTVRPGAASVCNCCRLNTSAHVTEAAPHSPLSCVEHVQRAVPREEAVNLLDRDGVDLARLRRGGVRRTGSDEGTVSSDSFFVDSLKTAPRAVRRHFGPNALDRYSIRRPRRASPRRRDHQAGGDPADLADRRRRAGRAATWPSSE